MTTGSADPTLAQPSVHDSGGSVYARVGADLALAPNLALRLDLLGGQAFKKVNLTFFRDDSDPRTAWGASFAAALVGVEARWF